MAEWFEMCWGHKTIFFSLKCLFFRPLCHPLDSAARGRPHPLPFIPAATHWVYNFLAQRCRWKKRPVRCRGSYVRMIPSKCRVWHAFCHRRRPVRISRLRFWVLLWLPKSFNGTLYMTSPHSLFILLSVFFSLCYAHISTWDFMLFKVVRSCVLLVFIVFISFFLHFIS